MSLRRLFALGLVLALITGACGGGDDDPAGTSAPTTAAASNGTDAPATDAPATDAPATEAPSGGGSAAGQLVLDGETIALDSARCFLQEQDAFGGGTILATAQATGTNGAGEDVLVDWTRFGEDTQFAGDDVLINIGIEEFSSQTDIGTLTLDGSKVTSPELTFVIFRSNERLEIPGSFEINC